jgi:hypothetical protein
LGGAKNKQNNKEEVGGDPSEVRRGMNFVVVWLLRERS